MRAAIISFFVLLAALVLMACPSAEDIQAGVDAVTEEPAEAMEATEEEEAAREAEAAAAREAEAAAAAAAAEREAAEAEEEEAEETD